MRALVVDPNWNTRTSYARVLGNQGCVVDQCETGAAALRIIHATDAAYSIVLLNKMLPDMGGTSVAGEVRRLGPGTRILMLSTCEDPRERVRGLDGCADDVVARSIAPDELVSKIRALLRRGAGRASLRCGALLLNQVECDVSVSGRPLTLSPREFALLMSLAGRAEEVVTRAELVGSLWHTPLASVARSTKMLDVQVLRLRRKLGRYDWMLETVRGVGFRLRGQRAPSCDPRLRDVRVQ
jgi:DNA-binding response OmpR family regulator